ncbi:MAG TPA: methyltransferase [candidate division Zixibacteria bacterium]|nr:methyltransferase [candidate division Zixibacteria bacterium]
MDFTDLARLASGHAEARIVQAAVQLGVFEALADRPEDAAGVARRLETEPRATGLLLNALAALGLLEKTGQGFVPAPAARRYLVRGSPRYLGDMILFEASLWRCWENLADAVRSGLPARPPDMYQGDPAQTEIFIAAMDSLVRARGDAEIVADALDWSRIGELLDVGSGPATYPIYLCRRFPALRVTIFDLPGTMKITERYVRGSGLSERFSLIAGDYRSDDIPGTYDAVFLSNIVHGEGDEQNRRLFAKLSGCLRPGGLVIVKDHILDDDAIRPPVGAVFSILMLLTTASGRCYTFAEIRHWMEQAGLSGVRRVDLPPPLTSALVVATK